MPFNSESAKEAGKKSKRPPSPKMDPSIKEKLDLLYEELLDDLLVNAKSLTKQEKIRLFLSISNYILPKNKSVRDKFTLEKLDNKDMWSKSTDPRK
jgi:hypothetical protein